MSGLPGILMLRYFNFSGPTRRYAMDAVMNFVNDEEGATAIEYGLMAALIAAVIIGVVTALGSKVNQAFDKVEKGIVIK